MIKYFKSTIILSLLVFSITIASCSNEPELPNTPEKPDTSDSTAYANRTILVYMAANNSLGALHCDTKDLAEMETAVKAGALGKNNRLIIFYAPTDGSQSLFELTSNGQRKTIKTYPGTDYCISSDFMLQVFNDTKQAAPALDYGLIMWSHSFGWTQNGQNDDGPELSPKTWGNDRGHTMNITTLRRVLAESPWSWIYFDCCFMGSVEVAYELYPVVDKIIASASEIPLDGMPYEKNLPLFFLPTPDLIGAAQNTFDYYDAQYGDAQTCTISVLDLTQMPELAARTKPIYEASTLVSVSDFANVPLEEASVPRFFDFGVYVKGLYDTNQLQTVNPDLYSLWKVAYDNVVIFYRNTPRLWSVLDIENFTGLSTFIPRSPSDLTYRNYNTLSWYEDVAKYLYNK